MSAIASCRPEPLMLLRPDRDVDLRRKRLDDAVGDSADERAFNRTQARPARTRRTP